MSNKSKRDSFVTKFAKIFLDTEGAWDKSYRKAELDSDTRSSYTQDQRYLQSQYRLQAVEILKYFLTLDKTNVKDELIKHERRMWRKAGFPDGYMDLDKKLSEIIEYHLNTFLGS